MGFLNVPHFCEYYFWYFWMYYYCFFHCIFRVVFFMVCLMLLCRFLVDLSRQKERNIGVAFLTISWKHFVMIFCKFQWWAIWKKWDSYVFSRSKWKSHFCWQVRSGMDCLYFFRLFFSAEIDKNMAKTSIRNQVDFWSDLLLILCWFGRLLGGEREAKR